MSNSRGLYTKAIHAGEPKDGADVASPLHFSTTYRFEDVAHAAHAFAEEDVPIYTRWGNPTVDVLNGKLAALEGAEAAIATGSGMAAIATALLAVLKAGDHVVATSGLYSATYHLMQTDLPNLGIGATIVPADDTEAFEAALRPNTRAIFLESPANPNFALNDIAAITAIARERGSVTLSDSTFATPYNQRPHELGVDVVLHSTTKFLGGHGDAIGGAITGTADFIDYVVKHPLRNFGGIISPFNAWLIARGIQTFPLRMARHNESTLAIANWLAEHPAVAEVRYPHHPSHPQYELARRQMRGGGGVLVFVLKKGLAAGRTLLDSVELCTLTVSLGDTRTLITHPATTTHASVPREFRLKAGIDDGLVRLAVGLEDVEDIMADLEQAMS